MKVFSAHNFVFRVFARLSLSAVLVLAVTITGALLWCSGVAAQSNSEAPAVSRLSSGNGADDTRYRIGAGDVLSILVRKAPELSVDTVRVDQRGMIEIPLVKEPIMAACKTESELAAEIANIYLEYKRNPSVAVLVRDFQSRPVAVIGAVDKPGQFRLQRQVRLLELMSAAGGPTDKAGRIVNVIHTGGTNLCSQQTQPTLTTADNQSLSIFRLTDTLKGVEGSNPLIEPGDIISVPEADLVFVVGHVYLPKSIPLKDKPITVSRAIAMAGGPQRDASTSNVRIVRQAADGVSKQAIPVNLDAILKQKAEDMVLFPNDIVEVGSSATKTLIGILTGSLPGVLSNGAVRAIP